MYIVQTCMYMFRHLQTHFALYKHVHTMFKPPTAGLGRSAAHRAAVRRAVGALFGRQHL